MKEKILREGKGSIFLPVSANAGWMLPAAVREENFDRERQVSSCLCQQTRAAEREERLGEGKGRDIIILFVYSDKWSGFRKIDILRCGLVFFNYPFFTNHRMPLRY
jgi:hypothetical protein